MTKRIKKLIMAGLIFLASFSLFAGCAPGVFDIPQFKDMSYEELLTTILEEAGPAISGYLTDELMNQVDQGNLDDFLGSQVDSMLNAQIDEVLDRVLSPTNLSSDVYDRLHADLFESISTLFAEDFTRQIENGLLDDYFKDVVNQALGLDGEGDNSFGELVNSILLAELANPESEVSQAFTDVIYDAVSQSGSENPVNKMIDDAITELIEGGELDGKISEAVATAMTNDTQLQGMIDTAIARELGQGGSISAAIQAAVADALGGDINNVIENKVNEMLFGAEGNSALTGVIQTTIADMLFDEDGKPTAVLQGAIAVSVQEMLFTDGPMKTQLEGMILDSIKSYVSASNSEFKSVITTIIQEYTESATFTDMINTMITTQIQAAFANPENPDSPANALYNKIMTEVDAKIADAIADIEPGGLTGEQMDALRAEMQAETDQKLAAMQTEVLAQMRQEIQNKPLEEISSITQSYTALKQSLLDLKSAMTGDFTKETLNPYITAVNTASMMAAFNKPSMNSTQKGYADTISDLNVPSINRYGGVFDNGALTFYDPSLLTSAIDAAIGNCDAIINIENGN